MNFIQMIPLTVEIWRHISIYGFRFWKIIVWHIGILLPVSTLTTSPQCACYCAPGYRILSKLVHILWKYDVMSIFQDGGRGRWILLPVSYLLMSLPSEGQSLSANQISSTYLNSQLRYNYVCFEKQTSAILEFYFRFRSRPFRRN